MGQSKSYLKHWMLMLGWLMCAVVIHGEYPGKCPEKCFCHLFYHPSDGPSLRVECKTGQMNEIPIALLDPDINQLIITPSQNDPNFLTIGPVLTQPVPFSNLRDLTITNSHVPSIGIHSFWGLHKLRTLNLTGNGITSITTENFRGLLKLTRLALDYNNINQMASETFRYMESLKRLSLSHNNITGLVPRLFRSLGKLENLDLSYNPIKDLNPEIFADIQNIIVFKCRQCMLRRINDQVYHLAPLIEELDLGENYFKFLMEDDFINLRKLTRLKLDGNQVSVIVDNLFKENKKMESLQIGNNKIALLAPSSLSNLMKLNQLDISNNRISKFYPETFDPVRNSLISINFGGNDLPLIEISAALQTLHNIEDVKLANLSINHIPANLFMNNLRLTTLDLSKNQIARFPLEALTRNKQLKTLDISHNKINSLNDNELRRLESIPTVHLSSNEWQCDQCSVESMLIYMKTSVLNESLRDLRCQEPLKLHGIPFAKLNAKLLDPCDHKIGGKSSVFSGMFLVFAALLATGTLALCCSLRRSSNDNTNENKSHENQRGRTEELLMHSQGDSVATIHSPHHPT